MERPPAPPEGVIIRLAREAAGISIADAAKRAGVSVPRWSQIETGSEIRHGTASPVTGRAGTIARMAHAVPGITPERLETEGRRPDAAEVLREILREHPALVIPGPGEEVPRSDFTDDNDPALIPHLTSVHADIARALGVKLLPGQLAPDDTSLDDAAALMPGNLIFAADVEIAAWDSDRLTTRQKRRLVARIRRVQAEFTAGQHQNQGLPT
jgi:transcriptional regulator with XRE-family HTH domain